MSDRECETPGHFRYDSEMLANNAVTLHRLASPDCEGIYAFPCMDHFHIGHRKPSQSARCKASSPTRPHSKRAAKAQRTL